MLLLQKQLVLKMRLQHYLGLLFQLQKEADHATVYERDVGLRKVTCQSQLAQLREELFRQQGQLRAIENLTDDWTSIEDRSSRKRRKSFSS